MVALASRLVDILAITTFAGMFACVLAQVVFRYFLGDPLVWSDELGRYLFIWCAFLGWILAARRRTHLSVGMVASRLPPRGKAVIGMIGALASIAFAAVLTWYGAAIMLRNLDVEAASLAISMGVVYAIVPVAAVAVALHALVDLARGWCAFAGKHE